MLQKIKKAYKTAGQLVGAATSAPTRLQGLAMCFVIGAAIILVGTQSSALATYDPYEVNYNDNRIDTVINALFIYLEGSFGALIMVAAGVGAIISSAFGQYKAALGLLVVAVGAFVLRSLVGTFFNDEGIG